MRSRPSLQCQAPQTGGAILRGECKALWEDKDKTTSLWPKKDRAGKTSEAAFTKEPLQERAQLAEEGKNIPGT